jgi:hypothetical protein
MLGTWLVITAVTLSLQSPVALELAAHLSWHEKREQDKAATAAWASRCGVAKVCTLRRTGTARCSTGSLRQKLIEPSPPLPIAKYYCSIAFAVGDNKQQRSHGCPCERSLGCVPWANQGMVLLHDGAAAFPRLHTSPLAII